MSDTGSLFQCVRCKRKLTRDKVIGYTHLIDWTYICRSYMDCESARSSSTN